LPFGGRVTDNYEYTFVVVFFVFGLLAAHPSSYTRQWWSVGVVETVFPVAEHTPSC